ncbi:MAG: hypothetical protein JSV96_13675 [Candidatus Aminicenantes bacterium]|nr:MAG: hypothetical protein JSV96_13675 [Candidatus Aminicenantes bacterium]
MSGFRKEVEQSGKFELRFYAGYKGDETPRSVIIGDREFKIDEILSRKRVLDQKCGKRIEIYKCKMEGEIVEITKFGSGEWSLSFSKET